MQNTFYCMPSCSNLECSNVLVIRRCHQMNTKQNGCQFLLHQVTWYYVVIGPRCPRCSNQDLNSRNMNCPLDAMHKSLKSNLEQYVFCFFFLNYNMSNHRYSFHVCRNDCFAQWVISTHEHNSNDTSYSSFTVWSKIKRKYRVE